MQHLLPILAYFFGSISSAVVVARAMGLRDPREVGSGNPGTTNVLRYGGKLAAALTLAGDVLKGVIPVLIAHALTGDPSVLATTALAAFLGHLFPVFFRFKGGKGVATALGVWLALNYWVALALMGIWLLVVLLTRYSSLAGLVAAAVAPVVVWWLQPELIYVVAMAVMSTLLFWRHRDNIRKLIAGTESRIGQK